MMRTIAQVAEELGKSKSTVKTWLKDLPIVQSFDDKGQVQLDEHAFEILKAVAQIRDEKRHGIQTIRAKLSSGLSLVQSIRKVVAVEQAPVMQPETLRMIAKFMADELRPEIDALQEVGELKGLVKQQGAQIDGLIAEVGHLKKELQHERKKTWIERLLRRD